MAIARHIMMNFEQRYGPPWCCANCLRSCPKTEIMSDSQTIDDPNPNLGTEIGNAQILATGMDAEKQQYAVQCANEAIAQHSNQNMAIAQYIMSHFEERYGSPWHCFVSDGTLGFYVRYDASNHIYFSLGSITVFLFKNQC
uniref:Dynein light chain n=1 Tax=Elaeophora elaphi TaxID=1147741 RepID=A0A0R3RX33_9BILA